MRPRRPAPSRVPPPPPAPTPARVAALTVLALGPASARRPAVAATLAFLGCPRARSCAGPCASCPFARPPSE